MFLNLDLTILPLFKKIKLRVWNFVRNISKVMLCSSHYILSAGTHRVVVQSWSWVGFFATSWTSTPDFPVPHHLPEFAWTLVHWVGDAINCLILCRPLLLLPLVFPSIRVLSNKLALHIRWPKYWGFSFSISPSNEYSGLISFRIDWLDLLAVQGTLRSLLQHHSSKASVL